MVNGFLYYRALECVSIASALSTALLTIYPCQIRVHQHRQSKLQPPRVVHPMRLPVNTVIHTTLVGLEPATFRSLVDRWSDARATSTATGHQKTFFCEYSFYPRDAMLARVIAIATCLSICLSVRLFVTRRYCVKTKKASGMISSPSGSPKTLVF